MTNSTDTFWSIDGVSLQTYAFNIVTWAEDREAPPPVRGSNVAIAYKPGQKWYRKTPDSRTMTLGMWVQGTNEDGTTPIDATMRARFEKNWKALRALLWRPRQQFILKKQFRLYGDDTIYSGQALVEFVGGLNMVMNGEMNGVFTVDLLLADPFFYGDPVTVSLDPGNPEQDVTILGDDRTMKIMVDFQGQTSHLRINNETDGVYMDYTKPLATGQHAEIDVENFTAHHDTLGANSLSTFSVVPNYVDPYWFFLEPGDKVLGVSELNAPSQSVTWTNLATNPSFETTSGTQTVATNLFTNSRFYAADPSGTLATWHTNLVSNAGFEGTTVPTTAVLSATVSRVTTQHHTGTASISVATNGTSGSGVSFAYSTDAVRNLVWGSAWVFAPAGAQFSIYFLDGSGARGAVTYTGTGAWQRVTTNPAAFAPGTTVVNQMYIVQAVTGSSFTMYVDDVVVTADGIIDEEFTGGTTRTDGNGFTYAWTGTANASTSLKKTTLSEISRNLVPNPQFANDVSAGSASQTTIFTNLYKNPTNTTTAAQPSQVRTNLITNPRGGGGATTGWAMVNGANALTLTTSSSGGPSAASTRGNAPTSYISGTLATYTAATSVVLTSGGITITPSLPYALSLWIRTSSVLLAGEGSCQLSVLYMDSGSTVVGQANLDFSVANANIWDRVGVEAVAPATAATAQLVLTFDNQGFVDLEDAVTFDFSGVLLENTDNVLDYFDGAVSSATPYTYAWTGTAHASTSTETSTRMVTRINRAMNPVLTASPDMTVLNIGASSNLTYVSGLTGVPTGSTTAVQATSSLTGAGFQAGIQAFDLVPGSKYTTSIYVYSQVALSINASSTFYASSNSSVAVNGLSSFQTVPANTWTRLSLTYIVPPDRSYAVINFVDTVSTVSLGAYAQLTSLSIENTAGPTSFFSAGSAATADVAYFTTGNGTTTLRPTFEYAAASSSAAMPAGATGNTLATWGKGAAYRATLNGVTGPSASLAVVANAAYDGHSYAALDTTGMTSGHTYTVIAKCTIGAPGVYGTPTAKATQIAASSVTSTVLSSVGTIAGKTYTFKAVFVWDGSNLRAYNGYQGGIVYWDEICLIDVTSTDAIYPFDQPFYGTTSGTLPKAMQANADYNDFKDGFAWTGTANASTSTFKALKPFTVPTENNAIAITSRIGRFTQNAISQIATSLRIEPTSLNSNASYVSPGGDSGGLRNSLAPATTYYISASVANTPQSGTLHAYAKRMILTYKDSSGNYNDVVDSIDPIDNAHHYIITTIPVGATEAFVRLYNGAFEGNGEVYWSGFGIQQIDPAITLTEFPYLVGGDDAAPNGDSTQISAWTGTRWNSASIIARPKPFGVAKYTGAPVVPAPALRYNGDLTYRGLTVDDTVPYNGQPVSAVSGVSMSTSTTYLVQGRVVLLDASDTPNTTDNTISVVWSTGVITPTTQQLVPNSAGTYDYYAVITTPASGTLSDFLVYFSDSDLGTSYWIDLMVVAQGTVGMPYLNGTTQNFAVATSWTGTANQSTSIISGTGVTTVGTSSTAAGVSSTLHVSNRTKSLLVAASGASTDSFVSPGGDSGAMRFGLTAGGTYTFSVLVTLDTPQTGSVGPYARQLVVGYVAGGVTFYAPATQAPNVAGVTTDSRITLTLPANTTQAWVRLYNGDILGDVPVWFDSLLIVAEVNGLDPSSITYFDGASTDTDISNYAWTGTADASTSTTSGLGTSQPIVITYQPAWI